MENDSPKSEDIQEVNFYASHQKLTIAFFVLFVLSIFGGILFFAFKPGQKSASSPAPTDTPLQFGNSQSNYSNQAAVQAASTRQEGPDQPTLQTTLTPTPETNATPTPTTPAVNTPVPSPTPTLTPQPSPTPTQSGPTPTPSPTAIPTDTPSPTPTQTSTPSPTTSTTPSPSE